MINPSPSRTFFACLPSVASAKAGSIDAMMNGGAFEACK